MLFQYSYRRNYVQCKYVIRTHHDRPEMLVHYVLLAVGWSAVFSRSATASGSHHILAQTTIQTAIESSPHRIQMETNVDRECIKDDLIIKEMAHLNLLSKILLILQEVRRRKRREPNSI